MSRKSSLEMQETEWPEEEELQPQVPLSKTAYIPPHVADIRKEWEWVKKGVEEIIASSETLTFRAEDIYASCLTRASTLWVTSEGFMVSLTDMDPFTNEKTFFIWLAWASVRGNDLAAKHLAFFENVARETNHTKLEMRTTHLGLMHYFTDQLGFTVNHVSYVKDI